METAIPSNQDKKKWGGDRHPKHNDPDADWKSKNGKRRCKHFYPAGHRCKKWEKGESEYCFRHGGVHERLQHGYEFQTEEMQEIYDRFKFDPNRVDVSGELALIRTCIQGVITKINGIQDPSQIPTDVMMFLMSSAKDAADLAERLNRIEQGLQLTLNVGQFKVMVDVISGELAKYLNTEQMENVLDTFAKLPWPTGTVLKDAASLPDAESDADCVESIHDAPSEKT